MVRGSIISGVVKIGALFLILLLSGKISLAAEIENIPSDQRIPLHTRFLAQLGISDKTGTSYWVDAFLNTDKSGGKCELEFRIWSQAGSRDMNYIVRKIPLRAEWHDYRLSVIDLASSGEALLVLDYTSYKTSWAIYGLDREAAPAVLLEESSSQPPFLLTHFPERNSCRLVMEEEDARGQYIRAYRIEDNHFVFDSKYESEDSRLVWKVVKK